MRQASDPADAPPVAERPVRPPPRWPRRLAVGVVAVVAVLAVVAAGLAVWAVRRPFPQTSGTVALAVLDGPVDVHRDALGVPTIVAGTDRDLYRALGYAHAQDRFWQMDAWRHTARGRTAELFGPGQLPTDRFLRTLGWERIAEVEHGLLDDETRQILADYADGVNAYVGGRPRHALGLEYTVLGVDNPDYRPRAWEPVDTLAFLKLMAWDLRGNLDQEIERAVLARTLTDEQQADLWPPYDEAPVIVGDWGPAGDPHAAVDWPAALPLLERLAETVAGVPSLSPAAADGVGSNSWVIGGEHTAGGRPILANDPHLGIQMPSIWHQSALRCAPSTCETDVAGFTFAGVPGIVVGHNDRIAWGVTNLGPDVMDLFVERVNPDDPHQYEVAGEWVDMEVSTETLRAADGTATELEIRRTRNGPIVSHVYGPLDDLDAAAVGGTAAGPPGSETYALALRWTALAPRPMLDTLPRLNRAGDWEEFRGALATFFVPGQSFVYADVDGTIGYQATGAVPVRAGGDGRMPVPGWVDDYQWTGLVPYDEMPSVRDPDEGLIVTANNPVVGEDYPYLLGTDWDHGHRAARIDALVAGAERPITLDEVQTHQLDSRHHAAEWLVPAVVAADARGAGDAEAAARARLAQVVLADWDEVMDADSAGAAVFAATWRHLLVAMFHERLPERYHPTGGARWFEVVRRLLDRPAAQWWDDPATDRAESRDEALAAAAAAGVAELTDRLGDDPTGWAWGDLHTATFRNQTLGTSGVGLVESRFNRGPYAVGGSTSIVSAVGWEAPAGYEVTWLPSLRMIVDLGDLDRSRAVHTTGQSGHAYHRHYTSMIERWARGAQHPMRWDLDTVAAEAEATLRLQP